MDNTYAGILFSEQRPASAMIIREVSVTLNQKWIGKGSQLKSLDDVKEELAREVKSAGGNALVDFTYGQRQVSFWESLSSVDDIVWWGKGMAARVRAKG